LITPGPSRTNNLLFPDMQMESDFNDTIDTLLNKTPPENLRERVKEALKEAFIQGQDAAREEALASPPLEVTFFRELMQCIPDFVYFKDRESRFITLNPAHAAHFGSPINEIIGKSDYDFFKSSDADIKLADEREILRTGEGFSKPRLEHHFKANGEEKWELSTKHPWHNSKGELGGTFGLSRDVTAKIVAERALEEQRRLMQTLLNVLPCRIFMRDREHRFRLINEEYHRSLGGIAEEDVIGKRLSDLIPGDRINKIRDEDETIMKTGVPVLRRIENDFSELSDGLWISVSKVPLRGADGTIEGIVGVGFDITAQKEAESRVRATGRELASKNAQIESELALARKLQVAFATFRFPSTLALAQGFSVKADYLYEPSEHLAGDFFQLLPIDDHRFAAFICDVMGHGVRSALVTAVIRGLIEENRADLTNPSKLFSHINSILNRLAQEPDFPRFVTASLAVFDTENEIIQIANAGHHPILRRAESAGSSDLEMLPLPRSPALGLLPKATYRITEAPLQTGCSYILYTDGILEEADPQGEEFGAQGIRCALQGIDPSDPKVIIARLREALTTHAGRRTFSDDVCAMAVAIEREPEARPEGSGSTP
jgi:sigma-B regulation protein RsbU (phosphoserine phosphatase)